MKDGIATILYILLGITAISLQIVLATLYLGLTINHFINGEIFMGSFGIVILIIAHHGAFKPVIVKEVK